MEEKIRRAKEDGEEGGFVEDGMSGNLLNEKDSDGTLLHSFLRNGLLTVLFGSHLLIAAVEICRCCNVFASYYYSSDSLFAFARHRNSARDPTKRRYREQNSTVANDIDTNYNPKMSLHAILLFTFFCSCLQK